VEAAKVASRIGLPTNCGDRKHLIYGWCHNRTDVLSLKFGGWNSATGGGVYSPRTTKNALYQVTVIGNRSWSLN